VALVRGAGAAQETNRQLQTLLQDHFLSPRRMREWRDIHGQLHAQVSELG